MRALSLSLVLACLLSLLLTPVVRRLALRLGALDPFSARKVVALRPIPRLGGLAVALSFYLTLTVLWLSGSVLTRATLASDTPVLTIVIGSVPILLIGALDDLRGLRALPKLTVEILVGLGLWLSGLRIEATALLGLDLMRLPPSLAAALSCALTLAWLVGVMNATNLIDGLDGLAGGVALFALATTAVAALLRGDLLLALLVVALFGAVVGFLFFNLQPASIFLGDAGSLFLGYLLAATAIWSVRKAATTVLLVCPAVALGLPLLDTSLTISRRLLSGRPLMQGDRDHVHHRLRGRFGTRRAVLLLYAICATFSALALAMLLGGQGASRLALLAAALFALALGYSLGYLRGGPRGLWQALRRRRQTQRVLRAVMDFASRAAHARDGVALSSELSALSADLGFSVRIVIPPPADASDPSASPTDAVTYPIGHDQRVVAQLIVHAAEPDLSRSPDGIAGAAGPDTQALLQLLCDLLGPIVARLPPPAQAPRT